MKHLLYILCLFVLSCDSGGGDGDNNLTTSDLNGAWWPISFCQSWSDCGEGDGIRHERDLYELIASSAHHHTVTPR